MCKRVDVVFLAFTPIIKSLAVVIVVVVAVVVAVVVVVVVVVVFVVIWVVLTFTLMVESVGTGQAPVTLNWG